MSKSKILFQMTGSIACYKACQLISKLAQNQFEVQVVASPSALQFVGEATLEGLSGRPVINDMYASGNVMDHIHLMRWADLIVIAPATAHYINKISQGLGDDLLTTLFLAHDFKKPFLIAPAMNHAMYDHPVTQASLKKLKSMGIKILDSESGALACGEVGKGRLLDPEIIFSEIQKDLKQFQVPLMDQLLNQNTSQKILITSGGTQESIDDVRVITNKSSGATGATIADHLISVGFDVDYVHGQNAQLPSYACEKTEFTDFKDVSRILEEKLKTENYFAVIHLAAISDYSVQKVIGKIKSGESMTLHLTPNPKIVDQIKKWSIQPKLKLIAFKLTSTTHLEERYQAVEKLQKFSQADLIIQNDQNEITGHKHLYHAFENLKNIQTTKNKEELSSFLSSYLWNQINQEKI